MKIDVTAEDISQGSQQSCSYCPIALAVKRALNISWGISVGGFEVRIDTGTKQSLYDLPQLAVDFIADFDSNIRVEPFSFELEGL